jgi:Ty3 transposon capsid-like protein/Zinc knuckle
MEVESTAQANSAMLEQITAVASQAQTTLARCSELEQALRQQLNMSSPHHAATSCKMLKPARYKGDAVTASDWLHQMESYLVSGGETLDNKSSCVLAAGYLAGPALTWWRRCENEVQNWPQFKSALLHWFCSYDMEEEARFKLDHLRQRTSVRAYAEAFNKCMVELPTMDEKDRIHHFVEGLKPEVRRWIRLQKPATLSAAISLATHADHTVWAGRFSYPTTANPTTSNDDGQPAPMELDAAPNFQRGKKTNFSKPSNQANIICWRCGKPGHMRYQCRAPSSSIKKPDVRHATAQSN